MSWEDLEGKGEASQHRGEVYRQVVEEYLESGEFLRVDEPYSGTKDIRLIRPAVNEEKIFRVETKNTKARLGEKSFVTEVARHCIDHHFGDTEFEWRIFAPEYSHQDRWRYIFDGRVRKKEEVEKYFAEIQEKHNLTDDEEEKLSELDVADFQEFIEGVGLKKATSGRLKELIRENESRERREKKWEFYITEYGPWEEPTEYLPNLFEVVKYPDTVWEFPTIVTDHQRVFQDDNIPEHTPLWLEELDAFSLLSPDQLPERVKKYVRVDEAEKHEFREWALLNDDSVPAQRRRQVTLLLNKKVVWRGTQLHDRCKAMRHDGAYKLIITSGEEDPVQQTLNGEFVDSENAQTDQYEGYTITRDMGRAVGHRYGFPQIKWYDNQAYAFISIGWLFTPNGEGTQTVEGDTADQLHNNLEKNNLNRTPNQRAQFRQWRQYLRLGSNDGDRLLGEQLTVLPERQRLSFERPRGFGLDVRPPKNSEERSELTGVR